jgi:hypothetical protein
MRGEIHGHVHNKKNEKVKTAAVMRQKVKLRLSRCPVDGKSNVSDATSFAISFAIPTLDFPRMRDDPCCFASARHDTRSSHLYIHLKVVCNKAL